MVVRTIKHVGYRGAVLMVLGVFGLFFGLGSLGNPPSQRALDNAQVIMYLAGGELWPWYLVWTVVGLLCWVGAFWKRIDPYAYASFMFVCGIFTFGYFTAQLLSWCGLVHHVDRGWVSALIFATLGFLGHVESRRA